MTERICDRCTYAGIDEDDGSRECHGHRHEYNPDNISIEDEKLHWEKAFAGESMTCPRFGIKPEDLTFVPYVPPKEPDFIRDHLEEPDKDVEKMSTYYSHLFGDTSRFAIDVELHHPDGSKVGDYDYAHWGKFQIWVEGKNLTVTTNPEGKILDAIDWDITPLLEWVASNRNVILHDEGMPISNRGTNGASTLADFWRESEDKDMDLKIRQDVYDWFRQHSVRAASGGGIFPNIVLRRVGDDMEISWDSKMPYPYTDLLFVEAPGMAILPIDEVNEILSSFLRETVDAILKERPEDPDVREIESIIESDLAMDDK